MRYRAATQLMLALALVGALTACSGNSGAGEPAPATPTTSTSPTGARYVALGDSFTAGPGLPRQRADAGYCQRSELNWPSTLAAAIDVADFSDLSCSGATTADVIDTVAASDLGPATRLVTISVGGNDGALFASLLLACSGGAGTCGPFARDQAPSVLQQTIPAVASLVEAVEARAPDAHVVLVGYPRILPDSGTCSSLGIAAQDAPAVRAVEEQLDRAQARAAAQAGVSYVSMRAASAGHDACAGTQAWTNGARVTGDDGIAFHPRQTGMAAVASQVASALEPLR